MTSKGSLIPKNIAVKAFVILFTGAMAAVVYKIGVSCVFLRLFHIPCPACGITRATASLLCGDFAGVIKAYPAYGALPILFLYFLYDGELFLSKWLNRAVLIFSFSAVLIFYVLRLINQI